MGYPLRSRDPSRFHLITIRTEGQVLYLRPSKEVNKIVGGVIARYQEIFKIQIFALTVMSNHMHLVVQAPEGNLDEFMENVDREIARRINYKHRRRGRFWSRRYRAQAILNEADLEEAFLYTVTNSVKHGGAKHPEEWLGLCSYEQNISEKTKRYPFYRYSEVDKDKRITYHDLNVSPLPRLKNLELKERSKIIAELIEERTENLIEVRRSKGQGFLTPEQVREIDPFSTPRVSNHSPSGNCYSKDAAVIREYKLIEARRRISYALASLRFRLGELSAVFPDFTFKPPLHRKPRLIPFTLLPDDYLAVQAA